MRPLVGALGESFDPDKLERLGRYEVHLDRKLARTPSMLLHLKDLRHGTVPTDPFRKKATSAGLLPFRSVPEEEALAEIEERLRHADGAATLPQFPLY
jgi:hypothetical protein